MRVASALGGKALMVGLVAASILLSGGMAEADVIVSPGDNLADVVQSALDDTRIILTAGDFQLGPHAPYGQAVLIENKSGLTITGQGCNQTRLRLASNTQFGFYIGSHVSNLRIENLQIEGTLPLQTNTCGIGSFTGTTDVHGVWVEAVCVEHMAVGISVATSTTGVYDDVTITGNIVRNLVGVEAGWGYGIHCENATNVSISNNVIENVSRHSIYLARAAQGANISITHNLILDNNRDEQNTRWYTAALVCSRASSVIIAHNVIIYPRSIGISVEPDEYYGWPTTDIYLVHNQVIGEPYVGIWLTTGDTHTALGNRVVLHSAPSHPEWCHQVSSDNYATGVPTSSALAPPLPRWANSEVIDSPPDYATGFNDRLYVMKNGILDKISLYNWLYQTCPVQWSDVTAIGAQESAPLLGGERLWIATTSALYEVDPLTWQVQEQSSDWSGAQWITALSGYLFILKDGVLYRLDPLTLQSTGSATGWQQIQWMGAAAGDLYLWDGYNYYRVDPDSVNGSGPSETCSISGTVKSDVDFKAARMTHTVPDPFLCMYGHHDGAGMTEQFKGITPAFTVVEGTSTDTDFIKELCVQGRVYAYHVTNPTSSTTAGLVQKES